MPNQTMLIDSLDALVFDFDGVLTNNKVHIDQDGKELVSCSRSDGLAFDVLRKLNKPAYILSTEKNPVVSARAKKLKIPALQGISDKAQGIKELVANEGFDLARVLYVGNDLNDYRVMQLCGYSACPSDSHQTIKEIATVVLNTEGGKGVVRELLEDVLKLNFIYILYP
jgi:3-deoxy-D-manno-octulosonate 8-phosphate phosphatase (KDO 8-P phosphatase)